MATAALLLVLGPVPGAAAVEEPTDLRAPSADEVAAAERATETAARTVATVRADLAVAAHRLDEAAVRAAQAGEAANRAAWELEQARTAVAEARGAAAAAAADLAAQRSAYGDTLVDAYEAAPQVAGLAAMVDSDGIHAWVERSVTTENAVEALESGYDRFRASATLAEVAVRAADDAEAEALRLAGEAEAARAAAEAAEVGAAAEATRLAATRDSLVAELAELQGISVELADRRQSALEARAARRAAEAAEAQRRKEAVEAEAAAAAAAAQAAAEAEAAEKARKQAEAEARRKAKRATPTPMPSPAASPTASPTATPTPSAVSTPTAAPTPTATQAASPAATPSATPTPEPTAPPVVLPPPPAPESGAKAAIAFATTQIGDPYRWGASGPDAWDCSGLTLAAWKQGGVALPRHSAGQYAASTPIRASQLAPGDLVFWGASSNPSSIYHVALYVGDGMIVHAPRTGRPVVRESMYYWRTPDFFARP